MKSAFIKKEVIFWLVIILPFVFAYFYWPQLPDRMPIHWNYKGEPDNYSSKGIATLVIPLINIGVYFLLLLVPLMDPKKENFVQFATAYRAIRLAFHSFLTVIFVLTIFATLHHDANMKFIVQLSIPVLLMVLGNFMGKIRPNYMVGIRTPWTLANEDVWTKTHRATGRVWVSVSLIYFCIILFAPIMEWMTTCYIVIMIGFPLIYSYILFKQVVKQGN